MILKCSQWCAYVIADIDGNNNIDALTDVVTIAIPVRVIWRVFGGGAVALDASKNRHSQMAIYFPIICQWSKKQGYSRFIINS